MNKAVRLPNPEVSKNWRAIAQALEKKAPSCEDPRCEERSRTNGASFDQKRRQGWASHGVNWQQFDEGMREGYACKKSEENRMAKLALIYGMRLLPEEDLGEVKDATVVLKNGRTARVTMHLIEGSKEEIENTFRQSIEAFFEMYPEI